MENKKTYYITTPLYYPSGQWHIGHCYTTVNCDALARYYKTKGYSVLFGTGTDEHGQKVAQIAQQKGMDPKAYVDERADNIKHLWKTLGIEYDIFIRTTDEYHVKAVQHLFDTLYKKGDIYKSVYRGKYCTPCESFWTDSQLIDGCCPDCKRTVVDSTEECYFFALSKYSGQLLDLIENTDFLQPQSRKNEMSKFIKEGLQDLAVSRSNVRWGVPVPFDSGHTVYVWIDALSNYVTMLGFGSSNDKLFKQFWPANLHMVGKEIVRFHSIIWPAMLFALGLPVPQKVYGHGWFLFGGDKMSKSKGNVVDPNILVSRYGVDAFRYYCLREIPFGNDGIYSLELFIKRINTDLVNIYGNLVSRTFAMAKQNFDGIVYQKGGQVGEFDSEFLSVIKNTPQLVDSQIDVLNMSQALEYIIDLCVAANKYIDDTKPWILAKQQADKLRLQRVLFNLLVCIKVASELFLPFLIQKPNTVLKALNFQKNTFKLKDLDILYNRLDLANELSILGQS
ncbi:MAG: methionine--tRNA ligase [Clostridiales bacterium]|jgi:methionyl-tRNA synthetase|nr:methionine--tRNA ligase [Clostridiales bacterium]